MSPEKENTFRSLKDEPLLMTRLLCRFGIHKWQKYQEPEKIRYTYTRGDMYVLMMQRKYCASCNIEKHRTFKRPSPQ